MQNTSIAETAPAPFPSLALVTRPSVTAREMAGYRDDLLPTPEAFMRITRFSVAALGAALIAAPALVAQSGTVPVHAGDLTQLRAQALVSGADISTLFQQARPANHVTLEQYLDWEEVSAPQLSPDGSQIIFSRRWVDKMNDRWESSVWQMNVDGTHARSLVTGSDVIAVDFHSHTHFSHDGRPGWSAADEIGRAHV